MKNWNYSIIDIHLGTATDLPLASQLVPWLRRTALAHSPFWVMPFRPLALALYGQDRHFLASAFQSMKAVDQKVDKGSQVYSRSAGNNLSPAQMTNAPTLIPRFDSIAMLCTYNRHAHGGPEYIRGAR
nr:hypothetical protein CFP56_02569 [Quercus suber]